MVCIENDKAPYLWASVSVAKFLTCKTHCWGINDWHQFLNIFGEELVKKSFIAVQQIRQIYILVQGFLVPSHFKKKEMLIILLSSLPRSSILSLTITQAVVYLFSLSLDPWR